jgi:hypothetical protein
MQPNGFRSVPHRVLPVIVNSQVASTAFMTGVFLGGIYRIGMKIAAGWFDRDLGLA